MARFTLLLLLVAISYVHTSEGSYIGESLCEACSNLWKGCHQWITSCFNKRAHSPTYTADYDKLALVYEWGPSLCEKGKACTIPSTAKKIWTIHGLWPFKSNLSNTPKPSSKSAPPIDCNGTYASSAIASIRPKLNEKWPNYENGRTNDEFWEHQYRKHGACAGDLKKFNSQLNYFRGTMDLYDRYDINKILANGDIAVTPTTAHYYQLSWITSALNKGLHGVDPNVYCVERKTFQYLLQVRLCFDKTTLRPITCGSELVGGGKCNPKKQVEFPPFPSSMPINFLHGASDDLAFQFLLDVAEMGAREMMMTEEE